MTVKDDLHHLVDELDDEAAREALNYLRWLSLPGFPRDAPIDDEPETDAERGAVGEAHDDIAAGRLVSHEQLRRDVGDA